jgi:DNA-binding PadR family transcriptional regulator
MPKGDFLGAFEEIVLLALVHLGEDAYGMTIRREIEERAGRAVSIGAVYSTLDRLQAKGLVSSLYANGSEARRGRARRYFKLEPEGAKSLERSKEILANMRRGLEPESELTKS